MRKILVVGDLREGVRVNPHIFLEGSGGGVVGSDEGLE